MRLVGPRWVPMPCARPNCSQLPLTVSARDPREGGGAALAREPRLEPPLARQGLGGFREDARPPEQAEAAAAPSCQPRVLTCRLAVGWWQSTTSRDPGMSGFWRGPLCLLATQLSCFFLPRPLCAPCSLHVSPSPGATGCESSWRLSSRLAR